MQQNSFVPNDGYYQIVSKHSGKVLDVKAASSDNDAEIVQYQANGGDNQLWKFVPVSDGYCRIESKRSGKVLDVRGASTDDGAQVVQYQNNGADNQLWKLVPIGDAYQIVSKHSARLLDVKGISTDNDALITQYHVTGADNQIWTLVPAQTVSPGRTYTVLGGDTLWSIAQKFYNDGNQWGKIYDANKQVIGPDSGNIRPGMVLTIPGIAPAEPTWCKVTAPAGVNVRKAPNSQGELVATYTVNSSLNFVEVVNGENVNGNPRWGHSEQGNYFWLGATDHPNG